MREDLEVASRMEPPTRVYNLKHLSIPGGIYIGRGSPWGNPYSHLFVSAAKFKVKTREEALQKYEEWLDSRPDLLALLPTLRGKALMCYCKPLACHGDILVRRIEKL